MSDLWVRKARPRNEQMDDWEEVEPERATEADVEAWLLENGAEKVTTECCLVCAMERSNQGNGEGTYVIWRRP